MYRAPPPYAQMNNGNLVNPPPAQIGPSLSQHGFVEDGEDEWAKKLERQDKIIYDEIRRNFKTLDEQLRRFVIDCNRPRNEMYANEAQAALAARKWEERKTALINRTNGRKSIHLEDLKRLKRKASLIPDVPPPAVVVNNRQNPVPMEVDRKPTKEELLARLEQASIVSAASSSFSADQQPSTSRCTTVATSSNPNRGKNGAGPKRHKERMENRNSANKRPVENDDEDEIAIVEKPPRNFDYDGFMKKMKLIQNKPNNTLNTGPAHNLPNFSHLLDQCMQEIPKAKPAAPQQPESAFSIVDDRQDIDYRALIHRPPPMNPNPKPVISIPNTPMPMKVSPQSSLHQADKTNFSDIANTVMHPPPPPPVEPELELPAEPEPHRDTYLDGVEPQNIPIFEKLRPLVEKYQCRDRLSDAVQAIRYRVKLLNALDCIYSVYIKKREQQAPVPATSS